MHFALCLDRLVSALFFSQAVFLMSALTSDDLQGYRSDPVAQSPFALATTVNISLTYMIWYVVVTHWSLANYIAWVRYNDVLLGTSPSPKIYLAFVVLSEVLLWGLGGPLLFYAAKYRKSQKDRNRMLFLAILAFAILSDVPLFGMDIAIQYFHGFQSVVQTVTLILRSISFFVSMTLTWLMYVHRMVKFLQATYSDIEEQRKLAIQQQEDADRRARGVRTTETKMLRALFR